MLHYITCTFIYSSNSYNNNALTPPHLCAWTKPEPGFQSAKCRGLFDLRLEVEVRFVDIGGIVDLSSHNYKSLVVLVLDLRVRLTWAYKNHLNFSDFFS